MSGDQAADRQDIPFVSLIGYVALGSSDREQLGTDNNGIDGLIILTASAVSDSFGAPNGQPPTPKQTPTVFPSPVFETPKPHQDNLDESPSSGWTPRFAEEYSVFNATPGNLRGTQGPFTDFGSPPITNTPYLKASATPRVQNKRSFAESVAADIATHANYFSPNPDSPLPPVEPSKRLQSSPASVATGLNIITEEEQYSDSTTAQQRSPKKVRQSAASLETPEQGQGQFPTPPPSARKGGRKLAPKSDMNTMQNDQGFNQQEFMAANGGMGQYVTTPGDMFGFPISAQATPQHFGDQRAFWAADPNMTGMDLDFSGVNAHIYTGDPQPQQNMEQIDWSRTNQMFQDNNMVPQPNQANIQTSRNQSSQASLISKAVMDDLDTETDSQPMYQYSAPMESSFGLVQSAGAVDPDLLFSRPSSSHLAPAAFGQADLAPSASAPPAPRSMQFQPPPAPETQKKQPAQRGQIRRSMSVKEMPTTKSRGVERSLASSPTKPSNRPGLGRSFSDNRGKKAIARASLPALAPAPARSQQSVASVTRATFSQPTRSGGRKSPVKNDHHSRLTSLSSIPESVSPVPGTRTQAKFTIDANGRARVETTLIVDDDSAGSLSARRRHSIQPLPRHQRHWSTSGSEHDDDDDSSTDDEPIIIPSRNTSFALPDPLKPSRRNPLHLSQRSLSERNSSSSNPGFPNQQNHADGDPESEAETVKDDSDMTPTGRKTGDAASELKKLRSVRQNPHRPMISPTKHKRFSLGASSVAPPVGEYSTHRGQRYAILSSPTKLSESSLPTPASSHGQDVRCICNRSEVDPETDKFMVQWSVKSSVSSITLMKVN